MNLFSIEAERMFLGALFLAEELFSRLNFITVDDFYRAEHREIYQAIAKLQRDGKSCDVVTVAEYLQESGVLERAGGLPYIAALMDEAVTVNVEAYAQIIKSRSLLRQLDQVCALTRENVKTATGKDAQTLIAETQTALDKILAATAKTDHNWIDTLTQADDAIQSAREARLAGMSHGVPTGLPSLDDRIGGYQKGRLTILAGRPSLGKTALALQTMLHAAKRGHVPGMCSLEMTIPELGIRSYANQLEVNGTALMFGDPQAVQSYTERLSNAPMLNYRIFIDDATYSLGGIVARAHEWKHKHAIDLLIVDHIGLVEADGESQNQKLGEVTRTLKKLAKRLNIPVLALCQLNRSVEKEKRRPRLSDLRDSGNIEQDCDVAIFLHSDEEENQSQLGVVVEIGALKTRYGRKGWLPVTFMFDGRTQKFREIANEPIAA